MIAAPFRVVLDANVLFPFTLRDTLLRAAAKGYFQVYWSEQIVTGHEVLVAAMLNDEKDRHVAAAAVKAAAQVIVTFNLRDFSSLSEGLEAQSPDEFLADLFDLNPHGLVEVVREQAAALRNPPRTLEEVVRGLAKVVPEFAKSIAEHEQISLT